MFARLPGFLVSEQAGVRNGDKDTDRGFHATQQMLALDSLHMSSPT